MPATPARPHTAPQHLLLLLALLRREEGRVLIPRAAMRAKAEARGPFSLGNREGLPGPG